MNRRQLIRNAVALAGAATVAPAILNEALPEDLEIVTVDASWLTLTSQQLEADVAHIFGIENLYRIYGICRAPGETDAEMMGRLDALFDETPF